MGLCADKKAKRMQNKFNNSSYDGVYTFNHRYIIDMLPYVFYGLLSYKQEQRIEKIEWMNIPLFALGFSINLIGTVATYNHWI